MRLTGLHQQPVNAYQRQTANQAVSECTGRHGEGQPASIRSKGFYTVAGGRQPAYPPVPVAPGVECLHGEGHPDADRYKYAPRGTGMNETVIAIDRPYRRSPVLPGSRVRDQPPYAVARCIELFGKAKWWVHGKPF